MKNFLKAVVAAALLAGVAYAQQDTTITEKEVRNPKKLKEFLEANATDVESRLTSGSTTATNLTLNNTEDAGSASLHLQSDKSDDAGDLFGLVVAGDGTGLAIQSDKSSKGTLATKVTISDVGGIAAADAITLTDADGVATISAIGFEANDAVLVLDADQGDDAADTWTIESEAADNDLSFVNGTTEAAKLNTSGDLTLTRDAAVTRNATVGGTLGVTGVATFTAESVHNLGIDADYITVDAGAGIDNKAAGTLMVGESTATKVEIADAGVETEIQGSLDVQGVSDFNEDITIDLDATDEEIVITQSSAAGTAGAPLLLINDDRTGATANEAAEATISIDAEGVYGIAINDGALYVEGVSTLVGAATLSGAATVHGASTLNGVTATGAVSLASTLGVTGNTTLSGTALVSGNTTLNGTLTLRTNAFTVSATGVGVFADDVTMDKPIFTDANTDAAPTNAASGGFVITVNGTNYWLALYPVND